MTAPPVDPDLQRILSVAVESVERLEILLLLRRDQPKTFTAKTLRAQLSITAASLDTHLAILCGRGFLGVTIGNDLVYTYRPISAKIDQQVAEIAALWTTRRADVEAVFRERGEHDPVQIFADAFRFKRKGDRDDG
jgi:hypothetical protein